MAAGIAGEEGMKALPAKAVLRFILVCACNMNRSMAAHKALAHDGFAVESAGTARQVKLPAPTGALTCPFGTPYQKILDTIEGQGPKVVQWYKSRNLWAMLQRNVGIKGSPARWQELSPAALADVDVAITFEERVFDALNEDVASRMTTSGARPLLVVNLDTRDDPKAAEVGAAYALALAQKLCIAVDVAVAPGLPLSAQEAHMACDGKTEDATRIQYATAATGVVAKVIDSLSTSVMTSGSLVPLYMQHAT